MSASPDVIVIGGGAGGIMAAWNAANRGARVLLLEKTVRLGTKILVSGGGKCNICHDGPIEEVLRAFRPNEARFLRPSFYRFTNRDVVEMFTSRGLEVYTRPDGRIFPVLQTARDVVNIVRRMLEEAGVEMRLDSPALGIEFDGGVIRGVRTSEGLVAAQRVIVAAGGSSYPNSGTTGDGFRWAKDLGHTIIPVRAALAPIYLSIPFAELSGLSLRDVVLKVRLAGKEIDRWRSDMLFTHQGISGPCALAVSRVVAERLAEGTVNLEVDLLPESSYEVAGESFRALTDRSPKTPVLDWLPEGLPERFAEQVFSVCALDPRTPISQVDRRARNRLIETLKAYPLGAVRAVPLEKGEVVAGGIALDEVDPQSMASHLVAGLYLCGEVLDIAGPVGGYNLQAAWSTGYVAGSV